jgi:hypothetical protein
MDRSWEAQVAALSLVTHPHEKILTVLELFKRRLQMSKNISIDFDELLPFYRSNRAEPQPEEEIPADCNTSFALPSKSTSEQLVQSFFQNWHALFPVLHRPSFQWDFEAMYTEKASRDPALFAQMWLVLAIAARDAIGKVETPTNWLIVG